jgi:predicted metal-dependent hydrolase
MHIGTMPRDTLFLNSFHSHSDSRQVLDVWRASTALEAQRHLLSALPPQDSTVLSVRRHLQAFCVMRATPALAVQPEKYRAHLYKEDTVLEAQRRPMGMSSALQDGIVLAKPYRRWADVSRFSNPFLPAAHANR